MTTTGSPLDSECFFIGPIGAEGSPERDRSDGVFEFIVKKAADELGLTAVRGDQIAEPGQITLQIIDHVLGARAAVVDLTGLNPNVFYEMAVRHTAKMPVVLIAEKACKLPFDIAQMRTIFFDHTNLASADGCRAMIVTHLTEALDKGIVDSPIATSIDVKAMQGGSLVERSVAELVTSVEELANSQRRILLAIERSDHERLRIPSRALRDLLISFGELRDLLKERFPDSDAELLTDRLHRDLLRFFRFSQALPEVREPESAPGIDMSSVPPASRIESKFR